MYACPFLMVVAYYSYSLVRVWRFPDMETTVLVPVLASKREVRSQWERIISTRIGHYNSIYYPMAHQPEFGPGNMKLELIIPWFCLMIEYSWFLRSNPKKYLGSCHGSSIGAGSPKANGTTKIWRVAYR